MDKAKKQEQTLKIISMFRDRDLLWNKNSYAYRRNDLKTKALADIAQECKMTVEATKKKLKALRSTYVMEKKKVEQSKKSGYDATDVYEPGLFWFAEMSFLDASIATRKSKNNFENSILDETWDVEEASTSNTVYSDDSSTPVTSRKRKCNEICTDQFDDAVAKIVDMAKPNSDAIGHFLQGIGVTLRTMPEAQAYRTMIEIQELVFRNKFSIECLSRSATPYTPSSEAELFEEYLDDL